MENQKHIAVIGAGAWGRNLVRNFYQLGVLKTVCDATPATIASLRADFPDVVVTDSLEAVLADPAIDAVVIATPAATHVDVAQKVLLSDRHAYVEKPLALTCAEGNRLVKLAAERGKILFVGHILQYHAAVIKMKSLIAAGAIGRLQYLYSTRLSLGRIRREENSLWSFAPHDLSVILSIVEEEPSFVDCVGSNFLHAAIADVTVTNLKFPSGVGAHIFVSWLNPFKEQRFVAIGSEGMLVFDDTQPVEKKLVHFPHTILWKDGIPTPQKAESVAVDISEGWEEPLRSECSAFLRAVATGQKPLTSGEEGVRVLQVLEASQKSLDEKAGVSTGGVAPALPRPEHPDVFVHPTAVVDDRVALGKGTKIWHFSHVLSGSSVGEGCNIGQNVVIGPDVSVGPRCKIQNNVSVYKGVILEEGVFCGPSMVFTNIINPRAEIGKMDQVKPTVVKKGATLGANCTLVCGVTIGEYAFVGAGAVVTKDVPAQALVVGNPARQAGWMCRCGEKIGPDGACAVCGRRNSVG